MLVQGARAVMRFMGRRADRQALWLQRLVQPPSPERRGYRAGQQDRAYRLGGTGQAHRLQPRIVLRLTRSIPRDSTTHGLRKNRRAWRIGQTGAFRP